MIAGNGNTRQKNTLTFDSVDDFPEVGTPGVFYIDSSVPAAYLWNGTEYIAVNLFTEE